MCHILEKIRNLCRWKKRNKGAKQRMRKRKQIQINKNKIKRKRKRIQGAFKGDGTPFEDPYIETESLA